MAENASLFPENEFVQGLYEQYEQMLYRIAFNILKNSADAEDAVQECFVRVIKNLDKIYAVPRNELRFYLVIIVRNVCLTMLKKKNRHVELDIDEQYDIAAEQSPEEDFLAKCGAEEIRSAVMSLSAEDCELLWLLLFKELSVKEITELLCGRRSAYSLKPATVRSRIYRAKKRLIQKLKAGNTCGLFPENTCGLFPENACGLFPDGGNSELERKRNAEGAPVRED